MNAPIAHTPGVPRWLHDLVLNHICPATNEAKTPWEIGAVKSMEAFAMQVIDKYVTTASTGWPPSETGDSPPLVERVRNFDSAIQRIAAHVGACCGGVDTGDEIDPDTGKPYGPGGHTAVEIIKCIDRRILKDAPLADLERANELVSDDYPELGAVPQTSDKVKRSEIRSVLDDLAKIAWSCDKGVILSPMGSIPISNAVKLIERLVCEQSANERSKEEIDDEACKRAADILRAEVKRLDYPKGMIPQESERIARRQAGFNSAINYLDPDTAYVEVKP